MRAPFLAIGGDTMFSVLRKFGMTYDSSMPISNDDTPSWPYTLDHQMPHKCTIQPCPQKVLLCPNQIALNAMYAYGYKQTTPLTF